MPLDRPVFPGEVEIALQGATLTSSNCISPAFALDDDPATAAVFVPPAPPNIAIPYVNGPNLGGYWDTIPHLAAANAGQHLTLSHAGGTIGVFIADYNAYSDNQHGSPDPFYTLSMDATPATVIDTVTPDIFSSTPALFGGGHVYPPGLYRVAYGGGGMELQPPASGISGWTAALYMVAFNPSAQRFLRVDWGFDAFITRIRLDQSGPGAGNAGIDFESSLEIAESGPPGDVPFLAYMPLPLDGTVHELLVQPPFLANGIVFYPDAFSTASGSYPALNLAQLQVYEAITNPGVTPMAQPTVQPARVGVQSLILYPWLTPSSLSLYQAGGNGANLYGLKTMTMDLTMKQAVVQGGESVHPLGGFGTDRQMKVGFDNAKSDLSTFQKVFGGIFTLIPANGNGPEVQYFTENFSDRELYVALVAQSTNGDGNELIVLPKLKVESVSYQLDKDKVTDIKMDFMRFWDSTYTRQDGQIGGIYERLFAASGSPAFHS